VRNITKENVEPVDILCGGFPCQDISVAGKQGGIKGEKSGLWWEMWRIISELSEGRKKPIVVLENVPNILRLGGLDVVGSLAEIGYDCEWTIISAKDMGACHLRKRWFCVAYPNSAPDRKRRKNQQSYSTSDGRETTIHKENREWEKSGGEKSFWNQRRDNTSNITTDPDSERFEKRIFTVTNKKKRQHAQGDTQNTPRTYWQKNTPESPLCHVDDGIPQRVARLKALGNAIVPQCSQWIGEQIWKSGILQGENNV
jgi:DNA (cytosine-5)-methyltransferase 1